MKKNIFLFLFLVSTIHLHGQTLDFSKLEGRWDTTKTVQYESAQYQIAYEYKYARDAKYPNAKRTATTILRVGSRYTMFTDYALLAFDSISASIAKGKSSATSSGPKLLGALKATGFKELILQNRRENNEFVQRTAGGIQRYQYNEAIPQLQWELLEGDSTIAGYPCRKARTRLFGRDYIAWYAPDVELPYGPYKFGGLPGLSSKCRTHRTTSSSR